MRRHHYVTQWERFALEDPYYAVVTDRRYRGTQLDQADHASFFASGRQYTDFIFEAIQKSFDHGFAPSSIVDFGCGVGRLAIAFSERCVNLTAVDVSQHMLEEARQNAARFQKRNIEFLTTPEFLERSGKTDLMNAYIVFQHIPFGEGEKLLRELLSRVTPSGFAAMHFVFNRQAPLWKKVLAKIRSHIPGVHQLANIAQRQPIGTPHMQMNSYDLNRVFTAFHEAGFGHSYTVQTNHGGFLGVLIVAQRVAQAVP